MPRSTKNGNGNKPAARANNLTSLVKAAGTKASSTELELRANWSLVDGNECLKTLLAVTAAGGALLFGTDSTGFGYVLTAYSSGEKASKWFRPDQEGIAALYEWMGALQEASYAALDASEGG